jgi:predicted small secreted protein
MKRTIIVGLLLAVVLSACGGSTSDIQEAGPEITVYKSPT